jgi:ketosteroid isomerase-like protein
MSQENVEIVRRLWTAFADGGLDALEEFWSEDIDWRAMEGAPDDVGEIRGKKAMRRYLQDWLDTCAGASTPTATRPSKPWAGRVDDV